MAKKQIEAYLLTKAEKRERKAQKPSRPPVFDMRATGLVKGVVPADVVIPDPYPDEHGVHGRIRAVRNIRRDPIGAMEARGQLERHQIEAARDWQGHWERAQVGNVKAMDTTKEPVDGGGGIVDPISDRQKKALEQIRRGDAALGRQGAILVRHVLAEHLSIAHIAQMYGVPTARERDRIGWLFRQCLDELAKCYGKADRRLATCQALG